MKKTRYTDGFKQQALLLLKRNGGNVNGTAEYLGIPRNTLKNWRDNLSIDALANQGQDPLMIMEVTQLRQFQENKVNLSEEELIVKLSLAVYSGLDKIRDLISMADHPNFLIPVSKALSMMVDMAIKIENAKRGQGNPGDYLGLMDQFMVEN